MSWVTGFSLDLEDKRVDKILLDRGFKESEIYYSPMKVLLVFWIMMVSIMIPLFFEILFHYFTTALIIFFTYLMFCYLYIGIFNRSFALTDKEFLVINSHFPFDGLRSFRYEDISELRISSGWELIFPMIFISLNFRTNYVQIKTTNHKKKFYCLFLDVDCFDENWTKRNLDDLHGSLRQKGINVIMEIN